MLACKIVGSRFAQFGDAGNLGVTAEILVYGAFGCLANMFGCGKIGLAYGKADDISPLGAQFKGFTVDGKGQRRLNTFETVRYLHGQLQAEVEKREKLRAK